MPRSPTATRRSPARVTEPVAGNSAVRVCWPEREGQADRGQHCLFSATAVDGRDNRHRHSGTGLQSRLGSECRREADCALAWSKYLDSGLAEKKNFAVLRRKSPSGVVRIRFENAHPATWVRQAAQAPESSRAADLLAVLPAHAFGRDCVTREVSLGILALHYLGRWLVVERHWLTLMVLACRLKTVEPASTPAARHLKAKRNGVSLGGAPQFPFGCRSHPSGKVSPGIFIQVVSAFWHCMAFSGLPRSLPLPKRDAAPSAPCPGSSGARR